MDDELRDRMQEVCNLMFEEELNASRAECEIPPEEEGEKDDSALYREKQVTELAEKILALLPPDQSLFYFHYCFHIPDKKAEKILGVSQAFEQRIYLERVLAAFMNAGEAEETEAGRMGPGKLSTEKKFIEKAVMEAACKKAFAEYSAYDGAELSGFPIYSRRFCRKLKKIRAAQKIQSPILVFARRAAVFLLVLTLGFSGAMVTNAEFRQKVVEWFVETFPEFTRFRLNHTGQRSVGEVEKEIKLYTITYIPKGFVLEDLFDGTISLIYHYKNDEGERLIISMHSENASSSYDTEDARIDIININDTTVYYWETEALHYAVWQQGDIQFNIISTSDQEEIVKVVQNIKKNNK